MYWLLDDNSQNKLRTDIDKLVETLSEISGNPHADQLFPYVGRKDRRKAIAAVEILTNKDGLVVEPFAGSGTIAYGIWKSGRQCFANEWEPYACRMANAPLRLPNKKTIHSSLLKLSKTVGTYCSMLYKTKCSCGHIHVLDSLFYDRLPLRYNNVTKHERLGKGGQTITYRGQYKCPNCGGTEKYFDNTDAKHMEVIASTKIPSKYKSIFSTKLIENSRINLSKDYLVYHKLFPKRSILALCKINDSIQNLSVDKATKEFLLDALLSILPQAKFKDYRSKSQDLHCPTRQLREVNIWFRFQDQVNKRLEGLTNYQFNEKSLKPIECLDFRDFFAEIKENSADLVLTDPPWTDGNAYFEKAQLYHPWIGYCLIKDTKRLANEFVVTDAPTRKDNHNIEKWWKDLEELLMGSNRILKPLGYMALFFRPIPVDKWLVNLNRLKLIARRSGLEPLLSIDVGSSDPSMRIQQSASYVFSDDIIFIFVKIPNNLKRFYYDDVDVDQLVFQAAKNAQESIRGPFTNRQWRDELSKLFIMHNVQILDLPKYENQILKLFSRYCDQVSFGYFLPKASTPFSGQLFDIPAIERLFTYTPFVINDLLKHSDKFTYERFLLRLAEYVENGTRSLINQIQSIDIKSAIETYAIPKDNGKYFIKRELPTLPHGLRNVLELEPYKFEEFVARLLEAQGFTSVGLVGRSGDRGVDVIATDPEGKTTIVQCKRYFKNNVSATPVQRLHSFAITRKAQRKFLITTSDFTPQAKEEAKHTNTELINGKLLEILIAKYLPDIFKK